MTMEIRLISALKCQDPKFLDPDSSSFLIEIVLKIPGSQVTTQPIYPERLLFGS